MIKIIFLLIFKLFIQSSLSLRGSAIAHKVQIDEFYNILTAYWTLFVPAHDNLSTTMAAADMVARLSQCVLVNSQANYALSLRPICIVAI